MIRFVTIIGFVLLGAVALTAAIGLVASLDWWAIMSACFVVGLVVLWVATLVDLFRRANMSPVSRVIWIVLIILFPVIGVFIYFLARPASETIRYRGDPALE
jgi:hypothetical protein